MDLLFFCSKFTKFAAGLSLFVVVASAVATVGPGAPYPPNACLCPPISVFSECFFGASRNDKATDNNKKEIIIFKHNSRLKFFRLFAKLLAKNCFT